MTTGPNNGLTGTTTFAIPLGQQVTGTNTLVFEQMISDGYRWGVTDILLSTGGVVEPPPPPPPPPPPGGADFVLSVGTTETGEYGNNYNGKSDADGVVTGEFEGPSQDLTLTVVGYDIDFPDEVQVRVNGNVLGFLTTGPNNGLTGTTTFAIPLGQQVTGTNTLVFEQMISDGYRWGVTDILLSTGGVVEPPPPPPPPPPPSGADFVLSVGTTETGEYGNNYNGKSDADGVVTGEFEGPSQDLTLTVVGYDIDFPDEVQVRVNGNVLGFLTTGPNNGLTGTNTFSIPLGEQVSGTNTLIFEQMISDGYRWGVTDILLSTGGVVEPPPPPPPPPPPSGADFVLSVGTTETGEYGNNYNGKSDADGVVTGEFEGPSQDLTLTVVGYDIDFPDEVQVRVNGNVLGFLTTGPNNGLTGTNTFSIPLGEQVSGTNTLIFEQMISDGYRWGVTDILLSTGGVVEPPPPPSEKPDIIVFLGDDVGSADMGPIRVKTGISVPNFNQLAANGIMFTDGYAQPACIQARVALVTGKWPQREIAGRRWSITAPTRQHRS